MASLTRSLCLKNGCMHKSIIFEELFPSELFLVQHCLQKYISEICGPFSRINKQLLEHDMVSGSSSFGKMLTSTVNSGLQYRIIAHYLVMSFCSEGNEEVMQL